MVNASNLPLFLAAVFPALGYLIMIYMMGRSLVNWKSAIVFVIFGCFSITFLQYGLHFIFPTISDYIFTNQAAPIYDLVSMQILYPPTVYSMLFLCFVQIALKEELAKMGAFF